MLKRCFTLVYLSTSLTLSTFWVSDQLYDYHINPLPYFTWVLSFHLSLISQASVISSLWNGALLIFMSLTYKIKSLRISGTSIVVSTVILRRIFLGDQGTNFNYYIYIYIYMGTNLVDITVWICLWGGTYCSN